MGTSSAAMLEIVWRLRIVLTYRRYCQTPDIALHCVWVSHARLALKAEGLPPLCACDVPSSALFDFCDVELEEVV
jgi:hypothetical protein